MSKFRIEDLDREEIRELPEKYKYNDVLDNKNLDKLTENYEAYEQEIADLKKHIETIYELIAGDDAINRFTQDGMIDYIKVLNEQIAEWEMETHESFIPTDE